MSDIIQKLAPETLSQIFFYLSYRQLIRTTLSSKAWRSEIMSNPTLHRTLDLKCFNWRTCKTEMELIKLLHDVASRSPHVFKELHLNISLFWYQLYRAIKFQRLSVPFTFDQAMAATSSRYSSLITTIFLATKGQLEKLCIVASEGTSMRSYRIQTSFSRVFVQGGIELSQMMPSLKELTFTLPFHFSMSLGEENRDGKKFTICQKEYLRDDDEYHKDTDTVADAMLCREFLQRAKDFTDTGLNSLSIVSNAFTDWETDDVIPIFQESTPFMNFLQEVRVSTSHLKTLDLNFVEDLLPGVALDLVINCPLLSSLKLSLFSSGPEFRQINIPIHASPSSIKSLELKMYNINFDWKSEALHRWIGQQLESFSLSSLSELEMEVPLPSMRSILNRNSKLSSLRLDEVSIINSANSPISSELCLPHLNSLQLYGLPNSGNGLFTSFSAVNLQDLEFKFKQWNEEQIQAVAKQERSREKDAAFEMFVSLLESCHSSLRTLSIAETKKPSDYQGTIGDTASHLAFSTLEDLILAPSSSRLDELLSLYRFPKLQAVDNRSDYSESPSLGFTNQLLSSSSSSLKSFAIDTIPLAWPRREVAQVRQNLSSQSIAPPFFSRLEKISLINSSMAFLSFFSKAEYQGLKEIHLVLPQRFVENGPIQDAITLIILNASSLAFVDISSESRLHGGYEKGSYLPQDWKPNESEKGKSLLEKIRDRLLEFTSLSKLSLDRTTPLLSLFQICQTPRLSEVTLKQKGILGYSYLGPEEFKAYDHEVVLGEAEEKQEERFRKQEEARIARKRLEAEARGLVWNEDDEEDEDSEDEDDVDDTEYDSDAEARAARQEDEAERALKRRMDWI